MAVSIGLTVGGSVINESTPLDFGTVQAGTSSAIITVTATNTGSSDALACTVDPVEASIANGFSSAIQVGTAAETYSAQTFAADGVSTFYNYGVLGTGKNYTNKTGGTLVATTGTDTFVTKWTPPSTGSSGSKIWGMIVRSVYV